MTPTSSPETKSKLDSILEQAYQLDLSGETEQAVLTLENALKEARKHSDEEGAKSRFVLTMMLPQFYLAQGSNEKAVKLLTTEAAFARDRLQQVKSTGTTEQKQYANRVFIELRDYQTRLSLIGKPAPEIEVNEWIKGEPTTLSALRGKVVLLEFWATWCKPCEQMFAKLKELDQEYADRGLNVIALTRHYLAYRGTAEAQADELNLMRKMVADHGLEFRVGVSEDEKTQDQYGAAGVPTMALIDRDGVVRYFFDGDEAGFQEILADCLPQS